MRIELENCVSVVIDIQERLFPHMADNELFLSKSERLLNGLNVLGVPVLVTQQYSKALGATLPSVVSLIKDFNSIEKIAFSCCDEPVFLEALKATKKKNVIILGIESHVCVLQTVLDLLSDGYQPIVVEDCVTSRSLTDKATSIERMRSSGAIITSYESVLFELTRTAGTDQFKAISKIVK